MSRWVDGRVQEVRFILCETRNSGVAELCMSLEPSSVTDTGAAIVMDEWT